MGRRKKILTLINEAIADNEHPITVLPLMCGAGKSSAISEKIVEAIQKNEGVLIITDRLYRFEEYLKPRDDKLRTYISDHKDKIAVRKKNAKKTDEKHPLCPVLMITSQRFLRLSSQELDEYLRWSGGRREAVIFDEKPNLYFQHDISAESINKFETVFLNSINAMKLLPEEKRRILDYWLQIRSYLLSSLLSFEPDNPRIMNAYSYKQITGWKKDGDKKSKSISEIICDFSDAMKKLITQKETQRQFYRFSKATEHVLFIRALNTLNEHYDLYSYRSIITGKYQSYFSVIQSEIPKMQATGSRIVILDGTADLSIDYNQDGIYINNEACKPYVRKLANLTIVLVECKTTKHKLQRRDNKLLKLFIDYMNKDAGSSSVCCFSYKDLLKMNESEKLNDDSEEFESDETKGDLVETHRTNTKADYFGNLEGRNDFQVYDILGQVGINLIPESYYLSRYISQHTEIQEKLSQAVNTNGLIEGILKSEEYLTAKSYDLLAEIEQNVFRSKIRNPECREKIRYYIFYEFSKNERLKTAIVDRFEKHYQAHVERSGDAAHILDLGKTISRKSAKGKKTVAQRLIEASDKIKSGTEFQISEWLATIIDENGKAVTRRQFKSALEKNGVIKSRFSSWLVNAHDGLYKKP